MKPRTVPCPTCGKEVSWEPASDFRPFCSERCQLLDLGDWAAERHRVPGDADYQDAGSGEQKGEDD